MIKYVNYILDIFKVKFVQFAIFIVSFSIILLLFAIVPISCSLNGYISLFPTLKNYLEFNLNLGRIITLFACIFIQHNTFSKIFYSPREKEFLLTDISPSKKYIAISLSVLSMGIIELFFCEIFKLVCGIIFFLIFPSFNDGLGYIIPSHINLTSVLHTINMLLFILFVSVSIVCGENIAFKAKHKPYKRLIFLCFIVLLIFIQFISNWALFSLFSSKKLGYVGLILIQLGEIGFISFFGINEQDKISIY